MAPFGITSPFYTSGRAPRPGPLTKGRPGLPQVLPRGPGATPQNPGGLRKGIVPPPGMLHVIPRAPGATPQTVGAPPPQAPPAQPSPQPPSPLDAAYYLNTAENQFKTNNSVNQLNLDAASTNTALQQALAQLAYQQPRDQLRLEQGANRTGGLFSSVYDQNLGNLNNNYLGRQSAATERANARESQDASRIAALEQGVPLFDAQQALAAADRASALAARNPALGQSIPATGGSPTQQLAHQIANSRPGRPSTTGRRVIMLRPSRGNTGKPLPPGFGGGRIGKPLPPGFGKGTSRGRG